MATEMNNHLQEFTITCDYCEDNEQYDAENFKEGMALAKADGWSSVKDRHGEWHNVCSRECRTNLQLSSTYFN